MISYCGLKGASGRDASQGAVQAHMELEFRLRHAACIPSGYALGHDGLGFTPRGLPVEPRSDSWLRWPYPSGLHTNVLRSFKTRFHTDAPTSRINPFPPQEPNARNQSRLCALVEVHSERCSIQNPPLNKAPIQERQSLKRRAITSSRAERKKASPAEADLHSMQLPALNPSGGDGRRLPERQVPEARADLAQARPCPPYS